MQLTHAQKRHFYEHGYVLVRGVVPPIMVDAALRAINHSVGEGMNVDEMPRFRAQSYCPEITAAPAITGLFDRTPALALAESLIGAGKIKPVTHGQIALRFPTLQDPPAPPRPHLDGMHAPNNGVPQGEIRNFTMLLGVMLSDVTSEYAGNLTVWPGTHHIYERYFREQGPEALLTGMPPVDLPTPVQLTGRAGDVVLCHYQLAHGVAMNISPHPRYAIYFRLHHVDHDQHRFETMKQIWMEWPGIQAFMQEEAQA